MIIFFIGLAFLIAGLAVGYLWKELTGSDNSLAVSDGVIGERMDAGAEVRRIGLGADRVKAHIIHSSVSEEGYDVQIHSESMGGMLTAGGTGSMNYLLCRADDEAAVSAIVDELAAEMENVDSADTEAAIRAAEREADDYID